MIDTVEALMREVAATAILPRFRKLAAHDVQEKSPGDLVTTADREAEALLTEALTRLLPGSQVVGEEAVSADPTLLSLVGEPGSVWVVDPVDGTANFVAGNTPFAVMVALLRDGETVAAWILDPVTGVAAVAERGGGAYYDGVRVRMPTHKRTPQDLRGPSFTRYTPAEVRAGVDQARGVVGEVLPGRNCAGYEYPALIRDEQQFIFFWRTLPWDHAPGVLLIEEAGGVAWHLDGTPYRPARERTGLLIAQNQDVWATVRGTLLAEIP